MRTICRIVLGLLAATAATGAEYSPEVAFYKKRDWEHHRGELAGFDEVRMLRAVKTADVPVQWGKDGIKYEKRLILNTLLHKKTGITDSYSLLSTFEFAPRTPMLAHGCHGLFNLQFFRNGQYVGSLHYAHGNFWGAYTANSNENILQWLRERGFPIDDVLRLEH